jgi:glycerate kinase
VGRPVYACAGQVALPDHAVREAGLRAALITPDLEDLVRAGARITRMHVGAHIDGTEQGTTA